MPNKLITPPDLIEENSILIINAEEHDLLTLLQWLKTVDYNYNIHLYFDHMNNTQWLSKALTTVSHVLSYTGNNNLDQLLQQNSIRFDIYGPGTKYNFLVDYFLSRHS